MNTTTVEMNGQVHQLTERLSLLLGGGDVLYLEVNPEGTILRTSTALQQFFENGGNRMHESNLYSIAVEKENVDKLLGFHESVENGTLERVHFDIVATSLTLRLGGGGTLPVIISDALIDKVDKDPVISLIARDQRIDQLIVKALSDESLVPSAKAELPVSIARKNRDLRFVYVNDRHLHDTPRLGEIRDGARLSDFDLYEDTVARKYRSDDQLVLETGEPLDVVEIHGLSLDDVKNEAGHSCQDLKLVHVHKRAVRDNEANITGVEIAFWDLRRSTEVFVALQRAHEQLLREILSLIPLNIYRKDRDKVFVYANEHFLKSIGLSLSQVVGKTDRDLFPPDLSARYESDDDIVLKGETIIREEPHQPVNSTERRWVQVIKSPVHESDRGEISGVQGVYWDIGTVNSPHALEEARAEIEDLRATSGQTRSLFFSLLQDVSSILTLAADRIDKVGAKGSIRSTQRRLRTYGLIHQTLAIHGESQMVKSDVYLHQLLLAIVEQFRPPGIEIDLDCDFLDSVMSATMLLPLGMILAELSLNSIDHGFGSREKGVIRTSFSSMGAPEQGFRFVFEDDGAGEKRERTVESRDGLGLRLVSLLAAQLGGSAREEQLVCGFRVIVVLPELETIESL